MAIDRIIQAANGLDSLSTKYTTITTTPTKVKLYTEYPTNLLSLYSSGTFLVTKAKNTPNNNSKP